VAIQFDPNNSIVKLCLIGMVTYWLTGYDEHGLQEQINKEIDMETFFAEAPQINPNAHKIRWLDKLVGELAKGKPMEKILRR
jgi:hypothetical protein